MRFWKFALLATGLLMLIIVGTQMIPRSGPPDRHDHQQVEDPHREEAVDDHSGHGHEAAEEGHEHTAAIEPPGEDPRLEEAGSHDHGAERVVHISDEDMARFGIETQIVSGGEIEMSRTVPGEIVINSDRMAHIVPRMPGIVTSVRAGLGDRVDKGQVLATVGSGALADAKASYLASIEQLGLAEAVYIREQKLREENISSEQEYLDARKALAEAKIATRSAGQKLRALGFDSEYLSRLESEPAEMFTVFKITAPFSGTVIKRHITLGEALSAEEDIFIIADLDTVWADLQIQQGDAGVIDAGQEVDIRSRSGDDVIRGVISYIDPVINENTRTALARVILDNRSGKLRPGTFITADILIASRFAGVLVAKNTVQSVDDVPCVFVREDGLFELRPVRTGRSNDLHIEILSGLLAGEAVATKNNFRLKAEIEKGEGDPSCIGHEH
ncbi:MAG: efflux RND transporter periplasmic adaptor subunit [Candidatus Krumholzibacteriota bacterium]|nr:efflux RND transporter periplasmic adaptor subunit [Candidatus Krumholzibacteriota bacterium]